MRRQLAAVGLGLRLARNTGLRHLVAMVLLVAAGSSALLLAVSLPGLVGHQQQRTNDRNPGYAYTASSDDRPELPRVAVRTESLAGQQLTRVLIAGATANGPIPPGIPRLPRAGEAFVSPALAGKVGPDDTRFGTVVGTIGSKGLVHPAEQFSYVGVAGFAANSDAFAIDHFGIASSDTQPFEISGGVLTLLRVCAIVTAVPLLLIVLSTFGVLMSTRSRSLSSLELLGVDSRARSIAVRSELAAICLAGLAVGIVAAGPLGRLVAAAVPAKYSWFASDLVIGPPAIGFVAAVVLGAALLVRARPRGPRPAGKWGITWCASALFIAALALLRAHIVGASHASMLTYLGLAALAINLLSLVRVAPAACSRLATWLRPWGSVAAELGAARLQFAAFGGVVGAVTICLALTAATVVTTLISQINVFTAAGFGDPHPAEVATVSTTAQLGPALTPVGYAARTDRDGASTALIADCPAVLTLLHLDPHGCAADGVTGVISDEGFGPAPGDRLAIELAPRGRSGTAQPTASFRIDHVVDATALSGVARALVVTTDVIIDPSEYVAAGGDPTPDAYAIAIPPGQEDRVARELAAADPAMSLDTNAAEAANLTSSLRAQTGWFYAAFELVIILAGVFILLSGVAALAERRRHHAFLQLIGASARTIRASWLWYVLAPLPLAIAVAAGLSVLVVAGFDRISELPFAIDTSALAFGGLTALCCAVILVAVSFVSVGDSISAADLRGTE